MVAYVARNSIFPLARHRAAFTFVELIIVVMVMGVFAAVAVPSLVDSLLFSRVESAARRVQADLELAQRTARLTSTTQSVTFNNTVYSLSAGVENLDHPSATYTVDLAAPPYEVSSVTADFGSSTSVTFDGYGTPSSGGTVVITTTDHECTVTLDGTSGDISITRNHKGGRSPE